MPRWGYWTLTGSSLLIALVSLRALAMPLAQVMPNMAHFVDEAPLRLWAHILGGPLALALVPLQMIGGSRWPVLHRWTGRVYAVAVLLAGLAGLTLAPIAEASAFARAGFIVLALAWIGTTVIGIGQAMRGDLASHRWWMRRSLALTLSAVTLRIIMAPLMASGWTVAQTYDVTAWGAWLINLAVLEYWQRRQVLRLA